MFTRNADGTDWYAYIGEAGAFASNAVKCVVAGGRVIVATRDVTALFPTGGATVIELLDDIGTSAPIAYVGKLYQNGALVDPAPVAADPPPPKIDSWGLARFTVANSRISVTQDTVNLASVRRSAAGKNRLTVSDPPTETLMAIPVAIDPSNDRFAYVSGRGANYIDIWVKNSAGALCDAAEVYVQLIRVTQP